MGTGHSIGSLQATSKVLASILSQTWPHSTGSGSGSGSGCAADGGGGAQGFALHADIGQLQAFSPVDGSFKPA
jgi:hypothetical protein